MKGFKTIKVPTYEQDVLFGVTTLKEYEDLILEYNDVLETDDRFFMKGVTQRIPDYQEKKNINAIGS